MRTLDEIRELVRERDGICPECRKSPFDPMDCPPPWVIRQAQHYDQSPCSYYCGICCRTCYCGECADTGWILSIGGRRVPCFSCEGEAPKSKRIMEGDEDVSEAV